MLNFKTLDENSNHLSEEERQTAVDKVLRDHLLEGFSPDEFGISLLQSYATGERTLEDILNVLNSTYQESKNVTNLYS